MMMMKGFRSTLKLADHNAIYRYYNKFIYVTAQGPQRQKAKNHNCWRIMIRNLSKMPPFFQNQGFENDVTGGAGLMMMPTADFKGFTKFTT